VPLAHMQQLESLIPGIVFKRLEGVGHSPNMEQPDRFNQILIEFLQERNE